MKQYNLVKFCDVDERIGKITNISTDEINAQALLGYEIVIPTLIIGDEYILMVRELEVDPEPAVIAEKVK